VLKASKFGPSLVFSILWIELLFELPLELVPYVDGIRSFPDVVTPMTPPNKGYILKGESGIAYLLGIILDSHCPEIGFESLKEVVDLPCTSSPVEGRKSWYIPFGAMDTWTVPPMATVAMHNLMIDLCLLSFDHCLGCLNLDLASLHLALASSEFAILGRPPIVEERGSPS